MKRTIANFGLGRHLKRLRAATQNGYYIGKGNSIISDGLQRSLETAIKRAKKEGKSSEEINRTVREIREEFKKNKRINIGAAKGIGKADLGSGVSVGLIDPVIFRPTLKSKVLGGVQGLKSGLGYVYTKTNRDRLTGNVTKRSLRLGNTAATLGLGGTAIGTPLYLNNKKKKQSKSNFLFKK